MGYVVWGCLTQSCPWAFCGPQFTPFFNAGLMQVPAGMQRCGTHSEPLTLASSVMALCARDRCHIVLSLPAVLLGGQGAICNTVCPALGWGSGHLGKETGSRVSSTLPGKWKEVKIHTFPQSLQSMSMQQLLQCKEGPTLIPRSLECQEEWVWH